jgi:acetylglutamate kinase
MKMPKGFTFSGLNCGIKPSRKDLALVYSATPCTCAAVYTVNKARAAPILEGEGRVPSAEVQAIVANSGNANALTGAQGVEDVRVINAAVASALGIPPSAVLAASTGVIGVRLPVHKVLGAVPALVKGLRVEPESVAEAIMTTDTRMKLATRSVKLNGKTVTLSALCKGSGMIAPQLATVVAVIVSDVSITPAAAQKALRAACLPSFNSLTVDNDMSTNDSVFLLANGKAGHSPITEEGPDFDAFTSTLTELCRELAKEIASDGEGATKLLEIRVSGAPTEPIARDLAKSIAGSSLVKAAMFGADPNWGRVLATVGARAGSQSFSLDPFRAEVDIQGVVVYRNEPQPYDVATLKSKMRSPELKVEVNLGQGDGVATAYGCDLSYDYVKINADYTSLIVQTPSGGVAKDDRLSNYSPSFKVSLLVEALSYISRFSGNRCVIKYGGAAMVKESLKRSFCDDINLLRSVGLMPIVVHGGGPDISKTLKKLGKKSELVDGVQITDASDFRVVEMVLSGSVNSEIVTLLNREGNRAHAVGLSGKDGALLRAKKLVSDQGRDLGQMGEIVSVNKGFLEMLLSQGYVPVISPVGIGEDGESYNLSADSVAAEVAIALNASKLIYLTDVAGVLEKGELITELNLSQLAEKLQSGVIAGGMRVKTQAVARAIGGGVARVHVIDGRTPHSVIAELFTDRGVGTLITA